MKIGVYLGNNSSEEGGAFTFQEGIFEAILQNKTSHQFYIFYHNKNRIESHNPSVKTIFVECSYLRKIFNRIIKACQKVFYFLFEINLNIIKSELNIELCRNNIDLVWFVTPEFEDVEVPYIITVWDLQHRLQPFFPEVSQGYDGYEWERREKYYNSVLPRAAYILTGTRTGQNELMHLYDIPKERIRVLPFPAPTFPIKEKDKIKIRKKFKLPKKYLFYPAQFWPHKNHVSLLFALKILIERYNLDLSIVFSGSDKGNLQYIKDKAQDLSIRKKVYSLGFVSREELILLYKNAFALVFPTYFGPDNLPPLEAMVCGCPVIASRVSGAEEQLEDAVLLVDPADEKEIADAVNLLYRNPIIRKKLIKKGYERAGRWTSKDYIKNIYGIIDEFGPYRRCWK